MKGKKNAILKLIWKKRAKGNQLTLDRSKSIVTPVKRSYLNNLINKSKFL